MVLSERVWLDEEKVQAVSGFPRLTSVRQVLKYLGLVGYYRRNTAKFAQITKPLTLLTAKNAARFEWSSEAEHDFEEHEVA